LLKKILYDAIKFSCS